MTSCSFYRRLTVLLCLCTSILQAQTVDKPKHLKNDQLLTEAMAHDGLGMDVSSPWHVRARYETFDEKGKHKDGGIFEEWWLGPKSYKSVYTGEGFNQTDVATEAGLFRSGDQRWATRQEDYASRLIVNPLSVLPYDPKRNDLVDEMRAAGTTKMRCVFLLRKPAVDEPAGANLNTNLDQTPTFCFEPTSPVLRYSSAGLGHNVLLLNDVVSFHSHYVARDMHMTDAGKEYLTVRVLEMDLLPANTAAFVPPPGSTGPLGGRINLPLGRVYVIGGKLDIPPSSVQEVLSANISLKVVIGKDGHVLDVIVVSGQPELARIMAKGVRKLIFTPFMILDTPVEVETDYDSYLRSVTTIHTGVTSRR